MIKLSSIRTTLLALLVIGVLAGAVMAQAQVQPPLKAGDRLVFLGDSITQQQIYTRYVMNYFTLRYPGVDITFRNAGVGGDTAMGGLSRLQRDVLSQKPTVVTICFGMNDGGYGGFNQQGYDRFMTGMTGLTTELKKAGVRVILLGPGCADEDRNANLKTVGYNGTLKKFSDGVKELAAKKNVTFFPLHDLMVEVQNKAKAKTPSFTMIPDSIHPIEPGQAIMAYALLKAMAANEPAASLDIDAPNAKIVQDHCVVTNLQVQPQSITFTRFDKELPTYVEPPAMSVMEFFPFMEDLNQYNFRVTGLKAGNWKLSVEGTDVGAFTEKELAGGVNLAAKPGPWLKLGEEVNNASRQQESAYFFAWRTISLQSVPEALKPDWQAIEKKSYGLVDQAEAARLKAVPQQRAWKWSLTLVP